jgi:hypothetical protein
MVSPDAVGDVFASSSRVLTLRELAARRSAAAGTTLATPANCAGHLSR